MSPTDINTRCTKALRALQGAGVIRSAWLPNQQIMSSPNGYPFVVMRVYGGNVYATDRLHAVKRYTPSRRKRWAHDLSDPVTAASLIVLVREAYRKAWSQMLSDGSWRLHVKTSKAWKCFDADTETEALVAALEAKVREVCGG